MPKSATSHDSRDSHDSSPPILCIWPERLLYIGRLDKVSFHRHAATVCVVALEGDVRLRRSSSTKWTASRSAVIRAGCVHALDMLGSITAVIYNDAHQPYYRSLRARVQPEVGSIDAVTLPNLIRSLRDLYFSEPIGEAPDLSCFERDAATALGRIGGAAILDPRVQHALDLIQSDLARNRPLAELANKVGLSSSRLQHLFKEEVGVPLRRLRMWIRFRSALASYCAGASLTAAALDAGFSNSASFSHAFRSTFGVSASSVLLAGSIPRVVVSS